MPFLKGLETLPKEESDETLAACDKAAKETAEAITAARSHLRAELNKCRTFSADLRTSATSQMNALLSRADAVDKKLVAFKKETETRKADALVADAVEAANKAEKTISSFQKAAAVLMPGSTVSVEDASADDIKTAMEKSKEDDAPAAEALQEAQKVLAAKQKEGMGNFQLNASLQKVQKRISDCRDKLGKIRAAIASGQKIIQLKETLSVEGEKLTEAEADLEKTKKLVPAEGADISGGDVMKLNEAIARSMAAIRASATLQSQLGSAPQKMREALQKLLNRRSAIQKAVDEIKTKTKVPREKALSEAYSKECTTLADDAEKLVNVMNDAEMPFLKGIEVLPINEMKENVERCEKAAADVQAAVSKFRKTSAEKLQEIKTFGAEPAKAFRDAQASLQKSIEAASSTLSTYNKDTQRRKKAQKMQEAAVDVDEVELETKKVVAASEPFSKEDADKMSEAEALQPLEAFLETEKVAKEKLSKTRTFLNARHAETKGDASLADNLKKLTTRLGAAQQDMSKARASVTPHEKAYNETKNIRKPKQ
jgi:uncharacterized Zn finger protein